MSLCHKGYYPICCKNNDDFPIMQLFKQKLRFSEQKKVIINLSAYTAKKSRGIKM